MKVNKIIIDYKTNKIEISADLSKESITYDISKDFNLEIKNDKRNELVKLNGLFDNLMLLRYTILEEFFVKNGLEFLKLQENMKLIQEKIRKNVPSSFI